MSENKSVSNLEMTLLAKWTEGVNSTLPRVKKERLRQLSKWGLQNHEPLFWLGVITEENGEIAKAMIEGDMEQAKKEAIECAACCIAFVQNLETGEA